MLRALGKRCFSTAMLLTLGKRCFSTDIVFQGKFFNREVELEALRKVLSPMSIGSPGRIVLLTGPRDSGKSALLREFWSRQRSGRYPGAPAFVDMRIRSNQTPALFAHNLAASFMQSLKLKVEADSKLLGGSWSFQVDAKGVIIRTPVGEVEFREKDQDDVSKVMAGFEKYMSILPKLKGGFYAGFPTFFIDEANVLGSWALNSEEGRKNVETVLRFLVRVSKQECAANVVLASSESFFKDWLSGSSVFRGHNVTNATVGHLSEEEARLFMLNRIEESQLSNDSKSKLVQEILTLWPDVFAHLGGAMLLLHEFVQVAAHAGPSYVKTEWEKSKKVIMQRAWEFIMSGFFPGTLSHVLTGSRLGPPMWTGDQWKIVVESFAAAPIVSYYALAKKVPGPALTSMIQYDFMHFRPYTGWDRDVGEVPDSNWPIVMPNSKAEHLVMKKLVASED